MLDVLLICCVTLDKSLTPTLSYFPSRKKKSDHSIRYREAESLRCTCETNVTLCVNHTSIKVYKNLMIVLNNSILNKMVYEYD